MTEALALSLENLSPDTGGYHHEKDHQEHPSEGNKDCPQNTTTGKAKVIFKDDQGHYDRQRMKENETQEIRLHKT
jgi:hypothetical protein